MVRFDSPHEVLLVRHTYGDRSLWSLPGGGFNRENEPADVAIRRELMEELMCSPRSLDILGEYRTDAEGKRDTVTLYLAKILALGSTYSSEIQETKWCSVEELESMPSVARIARFGTRLYKQRLAQ